VDRACVSLGERAEAGGMALHGASDLAWTLLFGWSAEAVSSCRPGPPGAVERP
jgi:hypothetical protein